MAEKDRDHIRRLREEANAIRKQEQAKRRRNRVLAQVGIIVGAVVVIGGIVALVIFGPQWFNPRPTFQAAGTVAVSTAAGEEVQVPITTTERGGILVGEPDAPVSIEYWFDFSCPHCVSYHESTGATYTDLIASGQVQVEYLPINYVAPYGAQAGGALLAVVQYQPELFFTVSDGLFMIPAQTQQSWQGSDYSTIMPTLGVTNEEALAAVAEGNFVSVVNQTTRNAQSSGVAGTPTITVNGQMQETIPTAEQLIELVIANGGVLTDDGGATDAPAQTPTP